MDWLIEKWGAPVPRIEPSSLPGLFDSWAPGSDPEGKARFDAIRDDELRRRESGQTGAGTTVLISDGKIKSG